MRLVALILLCAVAASAQAPPPIERRTLTLQQAVELALRQNPEYLMARLDEQKARQAIAEARSPFVPQLTIGSGLAYSSGFPLSIAGSAPSIVQAYGSKFIYNRPQSRRVSEAGEMAKAAGFTAEGKAGEIAFRVAAPYLDFERANKALAAAQHQVETMTRIQQLIESRVQAGRGIPLELTRARVEAMRARNQMQLLEARAGLLEETLRGDLGLGDAMRLVPLETQAASTEALPPDEEAAVAQALESSLEMKRLHATLEAKRFAVQAEKGMRYPRIDLVAQYAMLGRFNNYEDFFRTFQRHNGQLGMSFQLPVFNGQIASRVAQIDSEIAELKLQFSAAIASTSLEARRLFKEVQQADSNRELARLELDLARESLSAELARFDEGRVPLTEVEQARVTETQKWEAFYDSQTAAQKARLNLLRQTGSLLAALRP